MENELEKKAQFDSEMSKFKDFRIKLNENWNNTNVDDCITQMENIGKLIHENKIIKREKEAREKLQSERLKSNPLFSPENHRIAFLPIQYPDIYDIYKKARASFWVPEEIDFEQDKKDWEILPENTRKFLEMQLAFFSVFDQIVIENIEEDGFVSLVTIPEAKLYYNFQKIMEDIHVITYSLFPVVLIEDPKRREEILNATETIPVIGKMASWARKMKDKSAVERLVAFIFIEGVMFIGSFASIFYLKKQGKMPGLCQANTLISKDETGHTETGIHFYNNYILPENRLPVEKVKKMLEEVMSFVKEFVMESIPVSLIGLNNDTMYQYVQNQADIILKKLTGETMYNVSNPLTFMVQIGLETKTNFFDRKVAEYGRMQGITKKEENVIRFDADY